MLAPRPGQAAAPARGVVDRLPAGPHHRLQDVQDLPRRPAGVQRSRAQDARVVCLRPAAARDRAYELSSVLDESDSCSPTPTMRRRCNWWLATERLGQTVFIGGQAPAGAVAWTARPIDPLQVMRELDALVPPAAPAAPTAPADRPRRAAGAAPAAPPAAPRSARARTVPCWWTTARSRCASCLRVCGPGVWRSSACATAARPSSGWRTQLRLRLHRCRTGRRQRSRRPGAVPAHQAQPPAGRHHRW